MIFRTRNNENCVFQRLTKVARFTGAHVLPCAFLLLFLSTALANHAKAQSADPADQVCPRSAPGSLVPPFSDTYRGSRRPPPMVSLNDLESALLGQAGS
jgi:hypothetical protein